MTDISNMVGFRALSDDQYQALLSKIEAYETALREIATFRVHDFDRAYICFEDENFTQVEKRFYALRQSFADAQAIAQVVLWQAGHGVPGLFVKVNENES